jgi:hypothetical protein
VDAKLEFLINVTVLFASAGPSSAEIFPESEPVPIVASFAFTGQRRDEVANGGVTLIARTHIAYTASNGQHYSHRADAQYNRGYGTFSVINSETNILAETSHSIKLGP